MKPLRIIFYLLFILLFSDCRKKTYKDFTNSNNSPVFYFKGTINQNYNEIIAGENNYILSSNFGYSPSYNCYFFSGTFKKKYCSNNCNESLQITIFDDTTSASNQPSHINNFSNGYYRFYQDSMTSNYSIQTYTVSNYSNYFYDYYLNYTLISQNSNLNNYQIYAASNQTLTLKYYNPTMGCYDSLSNIIPLHLYDNFYAYYTYTINSSDNSCSFQIHSYPNTSNSYTINFGDGNSLVNTNNSISHTYSNPNNQYTPILYAKSNSGKLVVFKNKISIANSLCMMNYYYQLNSNFIKFPPFSKIKIQYIDYQGNVYVSSMGDQDKYNYFVIDSIENYDRNEKNQPTKKIKARVKAYLYDVNNLYNYIVLEGEVSFAVAYPN